MTLRTEGTVSPVSPRRQLKLFTAGPGVAIVVTAAFAVVEFSWRFAVAPLCMLPMFAFFVWSLLASREKG